MNSGEDFAGRQENEDQDPKLGSAKSSSRAKDSSINIPEVELVPVTAYYQNYQLTNQIVESLAKGDPEVVLRLIGENQRQQKQRDEQEFDLEKIRLVNQHEINLRREEGKFKAEQQNKNIIRLGITAFCGVFAGSLIYAAHVDDKNLPNTIITAAISLLAGGSTSVIAFSKREDSEDNSPDTFPNKR